VKTLRKAYSLTLLAGLAFAGHGSASAAPTAPPTVVSRHYLFVATNDEDKGRLGRWPIDRSLYAEAIARAREDGARAVVLKFFFDQPSKPVADSRLARAIASMPVYLQFAFGEGDGTAEGQPPVWRSDLRAEHLKTVFDQPPSLLPLPAFREHAAGIGFVNVLPDPEYNRIEILGSTDINVAASLTFLSIEAGLGAQVSTREMLLNINGKSYKIDDNGRVRCPYLDVGRPREYSLFALLHDQVPKNEVRDRVVIIGNTRNNTPRFPTSKTTSLPVHEVFFRQILCLDSLR